MNQHRLGEQAASGKVPPGLRTVRDYTKRCRERAIAEARDSKVLNDGAVSVSSLSQPGARYRVEFCGAVGQIIWFTCMCPSGAYRPHLPVPCAHAAVAGLWLEQYELAVYGAESGLWYRKAKA